MGVCCSLGWNFGRKGRKDIRESGMNSRRPSVTDTEEGQPSGVGGKISFAARARGVRIALIRFLLEKGVHQETT